MQLEVQRIARRVDFALAVGVMAASAFATSPAFAAHASDASRASAALRRACATGALTPYACAQHGVKVEGASPAPATSAAPAAASTTAVPPQTAPQPSAAAVQPASPSPKSVALSSTAKAARRGRRDQAADAGGGALRLYSDTKGRYTINIPQGWAMTSEKGFPSFRNGDAWIQLRDAAAPSAQEATSTGVALLKPQFASFRVTSGNEGVFGGVNGYSTVLDATAADGRKFALMITAAPEGAGQYVVIVGSASAENATTLSTAVTGVAHSLWFTAH